MIITNTHNYTIAEMVKTPVFWVLLVMFIFANAAGTMMVSFTSPIAQRQVGQDAMTAALCVSIIICAAGPASALSMTSSRAGRA